MDAGLTYQSPIASPLLPSWLLLAAAEAKLEVRGEGMMTTFRVYRDVFFLTQQWTLQGSFYGSRAAVWSA
jgi:hypothetical protein